MLRNSSTNWITVTGLKNDVADISEKSNRKNNVNYCIKQIKQKNMRSTTTPLEDVTYIQ